ncbi:hypothetical protein Tco_0435918 [Tanacetum coccineum]
MGDLSPITASTFTTRSHHETPPTNRASTSTNPEPLITPTFVENFKALESLKREGKRKARKDGVGAELEYSSEEYDEKIKVEPIPARVYATILVMRIGSPSTRRSGRRIVGFKDVHENANGQPHYSSLTFGYGGTQPSINEGENPHPDGMYPPQNTESYPPNYVNPYAPPSNNLSYKPPLNYQQPPMEGYPPYQSYPSYTLSVPMNTHNQHSVGPMYAWTMSYSSYPHDTQPATPYPNVRSIPMYNSHGHNGLYSEPMSSVTPFIRWIENYLLLNDHKVSTQIRAYDGKRDPNNYLQMFKGQSMLRVEAHKGSETEAMTGGQRLLKIILLSRLEAPIGGQRL